MTNEKAPERIRLLKRDGLFDGHWYFTDAAVSPYDAEFEYTHVPAGWAETAAETLNKGGWLLADATSEELDRVAAIIQASMPSAYKVP